MHLRFDGGERFFQGHFPGFPILPGVMQLDIAIRNSPVQTPVKAIKKMKFMNIIVPGEDVELDLEQTGEKEVGYVFRKGETVCSSGTLAY